MFECYLDISNGSGKPSAQFACCTGYLAHEAVRGWFNQHWCHLLLKHDLPGISLESWSDVVRRRGWDVTTSREVLADFTRAIETHDLIGFVVVMDAAGWNALAANERRVFGSASNFCFLRVVRLVLDRLEAANRTAPITIVFDQTLDRLAHRSTAVHTLFEMDSRAIDRVDSIRFSNPARHFQLQATKLLTSMTRRRLAELPGASLRLPAWLRKLDELPAAEETGVWEHWDKAFTRRHAGSIEWDMPRATSTRSRRN